MQCYTELSPPTAVTHAVSLPFLHAKALNLVVARASLLQVFELRAVSTEVESAANGADGEYVWNDIPLQRTEQTTKLVLVSEYTLSGTVTSLGRVKAQNVKSGGEALLVAFRDAKLSLVEWDPENYSISTISVHYYEGDELQVAPWATDLSHYHNYLSVDPSSRCAALKFGARHLAILPFRQMGDDLVEDDYDPDIDDPMDISPVKAKLTNGDSERNQTPYSASFVLPLTALDPALNHPIHLSFLYEYREPTFGIISAPRAPGVSLLAERKDPLSYTVFTLDIEQRASTTLLSVSGLPYDIFRVLPLPLPVGGALLVGSNELIHVDQAGKSNAVSVNHFAKQSSSFPMSDQSDLGLRLEGCVIEQISSETGDLLIIEHTGSFLMLSFKLDGRSVSGLALERISEDKGGQVLQAAASCTTTLGRSKMFVGSEDGDSVILGWTKKTAQITRKRSHAELLAEDPDLSFDEDDLEDDDDDDLYATAVQPSKQSSSRTEASVPGSYTFRVHDRLLNLAPLKDITLGKPTSSRNSSDNTKTRPPETTLELIASTGSGNAGSVVVLKQEIESRILQESKFPSLKGIWTIQAKRTVPKDKGLDKDVFDAGLAPDLDEDRLVIISRSNSSGNEESAIYSVSGINFEERDTGEFESDAGATIDVGTLCKGTRIIQVLKNEIRSYDTELGLSQILPMEDEATDVELKIVSVSFSDPYLLVLRDDSSVIILQVDDKGEIEEVDKGDGITNTKWISGNIYSSPWTNNKAIALLLNAEGGLHVFELPNLVRATYIANGLGFLPPVLTSEYIPRRSIGKATLTEILMADLGNSVSKHPYLIVRNATDDLSIYKPYHHPVREPSQNFTKNLRWIKQDQPRVAKYAEDSEQFSAQAALKPFTNIGGYSTVFLAGGSPSFILKESSSSPRVLNLKGNSVQSFSSFNTMECRSGYIYLDAEGVLRICQLHSGFKYGELGLAARKIPIGQDITGLCYYPPKDLYVLGTSIKTDFKLPEDDYHHEWSKEEIDFKPKLERGVVKLLEPNNWTLIDTYELEPTEAILCIKTLDLEVSEETHQRKPLIAVGTALIRGEDLAARGSIYVFEVINVVPQPDRPETNRKLKLVVKEEVKGAVTALSEIGSQGFLLAAQGQKCMVRGLKEDRTLLPVAFMDMQCYVTVLKALKGTGLVLMADAQKGVWFTGYTEEPYKMILFGKGRPGMEVITAELLPHNKQLYLVVGDAEGDIHVLQYNPEHPESVGGQRLLHKSTFHTGHFPTTMTLLPSTLSPSITSLDNTADPMVLDTPPPQAQLNHILITSQSGALSLLTPVEEQMYRRLAAMQAHLQNALDHPCGLNPREYRAVESEGFGSRGIVDGGLLRRWCELGSQRRAEACAKVGAEEWVWRSDLEYIGGGGLGYL
ncbi:hypothetical protein M501DRAFT_997028 [Patellaria atrata CBS 101060]|uniref:Protein CFT1 n=1 Tax=Patellaria atrata CBS 101060 TaxID=1346257 RepID=A0A9P4VKE5_9PEZI|nr:hypothetical protein M501DRAFT_997028 [Patellaria atrata CBS 101060]